jgi:aldose 1-epimerase
MTPSPIRASARTLAAGDLEAVFLPSAGMLCASLRHRGAELLRRVDDLDGAAEKGSTAGIPFLHPWANRLSGLRYRAAGREVVLDPRSRLVHLDGRGLPMHGVPWSRLTWDVTESARERLAARLDWTDRELLTVFPYPHRVDLVAVLGPNGLTLETTLVAGHDGPVPVTFGFHPFFGLPGLARSDWRLTMPAMRRLALDDRGIPTGLEEPFAGLDAALDDLVFDDGFAALDEPTSMSIGGAGRRIRVEFLQGFPNAQVFAPKDKDFIALEPMTAPTDALTSGRGLRLVRPGATFTASFRVHVEDIP